MRRTSIAMATVFLISIAVPQTFEILQSMLAGDDEVLLFASLLSEVYSPIARAAAASYFRRHFSTDFTVEDNETCLLIIERLLQLLEEPVEDHVSLVQGRLDAAWAITNIVCQSNSLCHLVVGAGGVEILSDLAESQPHGSELKMQCYWALGNIAADCQNCKFACRNTSILTMLANSLQEEEFTRVVHIKNVIWCTLNIVRGGIGDAIPLQAVEMILTGCERIIKQYKYSKALADYVKDCIWVVASLADDMDRGLHIEILCRMPELLDDLVEILLHGNTLLHHGCLRALGNIATGNNLQTEAVTEIEDFYEVLIKFLKPGCTLAHEAAWLASNIAAGPSEHLAILLTDNRLYESILVGLRGEELKLKKECAWIVVNMLSGADQDHVRWLVSTGIAHTFGLILELDDSRIVTRCLITLEDLLFDYPNYSNLIQEELVLEKIKPHFLFLPDISSRLTEIRKKVKKFAEENEEGETTVILLR